MDYEKKYKEALERAKYIYSTPCKPAEAATIKETLTSIFPFLADELAGSEDEQIRKALIGFLRNNPSGNYTCEEMATWLEKQDPKKHEEELEKAYKTADKVQYRRGYEAAMKEMEKQGETYTKRNVDDAWLKGMCDAKRELEKQSDSPIKWNKNTKDCKPKVSHSVLMKTTHGIAEGEWQGEHWHQYRWAGLVRDIDVLSWIELSDLEKQTYEQ